jgi:hypothetical protein
MIVENQGFVIKNTVTGRIHREPNKKSYANTTYKTEGAAKAGVTRTLKYYAKAIAEVEDLVANGHKAYEARFYNAYRDATDESLDRTYINDPDTYEIVTREAYGDPQRTDTGTCPFNGLPMTRTIGVNDAWTHLDPLCESHWTQ